MLAEYVTHLHETEKSPATIAQAVVNVNWHAKNAGINRVNNEGDRVSDIVGVIAERTAAGIRSAGNGCRLSAHRSIKKDGPDGRGQITLHRP